MAGDSSLLTETSQYSGFCTSGIPLCIIIINGGHREGVDDCALFRLTDDGLAYYRMGYEFAAGIMGLRIDNKPAVEEISRYKSMGDAREAHSKLPPEEQARTLIRSVVRRT